MDKAHNHVKIFNIGIKWRASLSVSVSRFIAFHSISPQSDASSLSATKQVTAECFDTVVGGPGGIVGVM